MTGPIPGRGIIGNKASLSREEKHKATGTMRVLIEGPRGSPKNGEIHMEQACPLTLDHSGAVYPRGTPLLIGCIQDKYLAKNDEGHMAQGTTRFTGPANVAAAPVAGKIQ